MKFSCAYPDPSSRTVTVYLKNIAYGKEKLLQINTQNNIKNIKEK